MQLLPHLISLTVLLLSLTIKGTVGFHSPTTSRKQQPSSTTIISMTASYICPNETTKQLYNIAGSGWSSPHWNWGSAQGTGHDCAMICRKRWESKSDRRTLVKSLLNPVEYKASLPENLDNHGEVSFEEIKLILGLAWQRGRWDGSDGGPRGYSEVLNIMANAKRYEDEDEVISALNFIDDVSRRFETISRNAEELGRMKELMYDVRGKHHAGKEEVFMDRRTCAGLVLDAMGFVDNGL